MQITDSIADMLTRIRNANSAKHDTVKIPASNMKKAIAQILLDEGYIKGFKVEDDGKQGVIEIALKYGPNKSQVITGLRRVSKPGLRIYTNCEDMPRVMKGLEGLVRAQALSENALTLTEGVALRDILSGREWRLGGVMRVRVAGVDVSQGNVDFVPAQEQ